MAQITDAAVPATEIQSYHRIYEYRTMIGVVGVQFIAYIKREEGIKAAHFPGYIDPAEEGNQRTGIEVPFFL